MFQCKELDPIDGRPKHETPRRAREQAAKNALKIKSIFGGGHMGYLEMVTKPTALKWIVQKIKGNIAHVPAGHHKHPKKGTDCEIYGNRGEHPPSGRHRKIAANPVIEVRSR